MTRDRLATAALAVALAAGAAACGSDDVAAPTDTTAVASTPAITAATVAPTTAAPTTAAPTTAAPTTTTPTATDDDPVEAAAAAWVVVFDSEQPFEEKALHLADADALRPTVEAYQAAGSGFGGINLEPTDVVVDGDTATITYDVNFGANPAYGDQVGTIELVDGVWTVSRDEFCSFMASARVSCT